MDEPNSRLDSHAAAIVMHIVHNIVNTSRTFFYTIHQPNIDIFEDFDEVNSKTFMINLCNVKQTTFLLCFFAWLDKRKWEQRDRIKQGSTEQIISKSSVLLVS